MNQTPDALPAMAVTAAFAAGETRLVNVAQARNKETDRISAVACELKKLGINIEELPDGLIISKSGLKPAQLLRWMDRNGIEQAVVMAVEVPEEFPVR